MVPNRRRSGRVRNHPKSANSGSRMRTAMVAFTLLPAIIAFEESAVSATPATSADYRTSETADGADSDDLYVQVNKKVPTFGGAYWNSNGDLQIALTRPDSEAGKDAAFALREIVNSGVDVAKPQIAHAEYTFIELKEWKDRLYGLHQAVPQLVSTGITQSRNRIQLGVTDSEKNRAVIVENLDQLQIPRGAVLISEEAPIQALSELNDRHRPIRSGLRIRTPAEPGGLFTRACTVGPLAVNSGMTGFVTAAHCSRYQGEVDHEHYYQPGPDASVISPPFDRIGSERKDPFLSSSNCPYAGRKCSTTDANFVQFEPGTSYKRGTIARTSSGTNWNGSNVYRITSKSDTMEGWVVRKVGATTGNTAGTVLNTCVDFHSDSPNPGITIRCQVRTWMHADFGDSGAAGFGLTNSPNTNDVALRGILVGGSNPGGVGNVYFTKISRIQARMGTMTVCASGFSC